jgi:predicted ribosome quality control (RQC) complex YloA/Tae2 family protein
VETLRAEVPAVPAGARGAAAPSLPYRVYRSSGGLEIRVGRGARHNDDLTFHHSAPDDVWLHARHAAGAHVVLRWQGEDNPPARDLREAAVLAAVCSKARTSGSVPVDWTRRKYVRKPRRAPPGQVLVERVKTLFVAPDPALEERLRDAPGGEG